MRAQEAAIGLFSVVGGIIGGNSVKKGLNNASNAQSESSDDQIARLEAALSSATAAYNPYSTLGSSASGAYADLMGIGGSAGGPDWNEYLAANPDVMAAYEKDGRFSTPQEYAQYHYNTYGQGEGRSNFGSDAVSANDAQASAISALEKSPLFTSLIRNGEEAITQNASATGGLRGGNIQGGLADFRADTLASTIQQQLAGYQGAIGTGLTAANGVTNATYNTATGSNTAQQSATDALIQKILGKAGINSQNWSNVGAFADKAASGGGIGKAIKSIGSIF